MFGMKQESLTKQVLDRLSKLQELPKEGFLCGGAVANTILTIIDGKEYPVNDLDIFLIEDTLKENIFSNSPTRIAGLDINNDRYENRIIIPSSLTNYKILSTNYDNLINYVHVYISYPEEMSIKEKYSLVLDSFDINCCKVGIDLESNNLYLTHDFTEFIRTRQLECVNPVTPAHSAIRLIKKKEELNAFLNKEEQFKFLSQFYLYNNNAINHKLNLTLFFGKKYKDLFHKYENELSEYFELWSHGKTRRHYSRLIQEEFEESSIFEDNGLKIPKWVFSIHQNYTDPKLVEKWYETKLWALIPKRYNKFDEEIAKYYRPEFGTNPTIIKKIWDLLYKQNKKQKNKCLKLLATKELYSFVIANDDFHNCDFSDINIEKLVRFIEDNPNFTKLIAVSKLNFQESERLMYMLKKLFPQELELFCDLISKELYDEKYFKSDFDGKKILDKNYITNKFNMIKNILSKELTEKLDLSDFEYKNIIKELICPLDLLWGGKFMHNCLKGYGENGFHLRIERGEIKVFIISDDKERSALQISKTHSNTYKIDQIYGHSNTQVCTKHKMIADYLIKFLEYEHYLLESEKIIQNFKINRISLTEKINVSGYEKELDPFRALFDNDIMPMPIVNEPLNLGYTVRANIGINEEENDIDEDIDWDDGFGY